MKLAITNKCNIKTYIFPFICPCVYIMCSLNTGNTLPTNQCYTLRCLAESPRVNHRRPHSGWPTVPRMTECRHMLLKSERINYCVCFCEHFLWRVALRFGRLTSKTCHFKFVKQMQFLEYIFRFKYFSAIDWGRNNALSASWYFAIIWMWMAMHRVLYGHFCAVVY